MESQLTRNIFIDQLRKLVSFKTITGQPEDFEAAFEYITGILHPRAIVQVGTNKGEKYLLASNAKTLVPDVLFVVHVDVVSAKPEQFQLTQDGSMVFGRGVSDMKWAIPVGVALLSHLIETESTLTYTLAVTSDEERGGFNGAGYLANEMGLLPKVAIVLDGGKDFELVNKSKGVCQLKITKTGKPAHSSRPWEGESALTAILELAHKLMRLYNENNSSSGWHTTMNIGTMNSGKLVNQVPGYAEMRIDFRFPPETDSVKSLFELVCELAKNVDPEIKVEITAEGTTSFVEPNDPALVLFKDLLERRLGREVPIVGSFGSNDARHFNNLGAPFIMVKPDGGDIHGDNEYADVDANLLLYEVLVEFLERYSEDL